MTWLSFGLILTGVLLNAAAQLFSRPAPTRWV